MSPVDPRYLAARRVLLDVLLALEAQADALIIAGAQAVYLHTGDGDLAVAHSRPMPTSPSTQSCCTGTRCWRRR